MGNCDSHTKCPRFEKHYPDLDLCPKGRDHSPKDRKVANDYPEAIGTKKGDDWIVPNSCGPAGSLGLHISCPCNGEWEQGETGINQCTYNDGIPACTRPWGCSGGCCGIAGTQLRCRRIGYTGEPAVCCLIPSTSTTNDGRNTCDPKYSNPSGEACQTPLTEYCKKTVNLKQWIGETGVCYNAWNNNTNTETKKSMLSAALGNFAEFNPVDTKNETGIELWDQFRSLCGQLPEACDSTLSTSCKGYSRKQVSQSAINMGTKCKPGKPCMDQNLVSMCACHLDPSQYTEYSGIIDKKEYESCDPLCVLPGAIPATAGGKSITCDENICILDDITFNIVDSNVGNITFSQVCPGCTQDPNDPKKCTNPALCYFGNMNFFAQGSEVGELKLKQNCDQCFKITDDPANPEQIDCGTGNPTGNGPRPPRPEPSKPVEIFDEIRDWVEEHKVATIFIVIGLLLLIFFIIWLIRRNRGGKTNGDSELYDNAALLASAS